MDVEHCGCSRPDSFEDECGRVFCLKCAGFLSQKPFQYAPLEAPCEIRLIRLLPGAGEQPLHCEIFHADLNTELDYEAVSYTWGGLELRSSIYCGKAGALAITQNCEDALRDLRYTNRKRVLWIDAISIDQAKTGERSHQVKQMRRIFAQAEHVVIYLGRASAALASSILHAGKTSPAPTDDILHGFKIEDNKGNVEDVQTAVTALLSIPWFNRVWVLQEVAAARDATVLLGQCKIDWSFLTLGRLASLRGVTVANNRGLTPAVLQITPGNCHPLPDLMAMLTTARSCFASDPRDKIYALQGLLRNPRSLNISPDYDVSAEDLYTEVTVQVIRSYNHLGILSEIGKEATQIEEASPCEQEIVQLSQQAEQALDGARIATHRLRASLQKLCQPELEGFTRCTEQQPSLGGDFRSRLGLVSPSVSQFLLGESPNTWLVFLKLLYWNPSKPTKAALQEWGISDFTQIARLLGFGDRHELSAMVSFLPSDMPKAGLKYLESMTRRGQHFLPSSKFVEETSEKIAKEVAQEIEHAEHLSKARTEIMQYATEAENETAGAEILHKELQEMHPFSEGFAIRPQWLFPDEGGDGDASTTLDLPSWVPDFSKQGRLSSFDSWRSTPHLDSPVAFSSTPPPSNRVALRVKAIRVGFFDSTTSCEELRRDLENLERLQADGDDPTKPLGHYSRAQKLSTAKWNTFQRFYRGRKIGRTDQSFSICPMRTRASDLIYVLDGAQVPFVLRPKLPRSDFLTFELIGECYLHGLEIFDSQITIRGRARTWSEDEIAWDQISWDEGSWEAIQIE